jgi:hypothetical protein
MPDDRKYVRVYYSIQDDPKFDRVRGNVGLLGTWLRLLMAADAVWPSSAYVPRGLRASDVRAIVEAGLVDELPEHRFRIHGLDAERQARSDAGRNAAAVRWYREGNADPMPRRAEHNKAETRLAEDVERIDGPFAADGSRLVRVVQPKGKTA